MAIALGSIMAKFTLDISDLSTKLKLAEEAIENTEKKFDGWTDIGDRISGVGMGLTMGLTMPIVGAGAASFKLASDMNESINKVDVAFKNNAQEVKDWSETTLEKFGLAQMTALDMVSVFGDMGTGMGFNTSQAAKMGVSLVGLAADLASFKNISIDRAQSALTGVYTGETESLKALGIVMTQVNLQEYASSQGIKKKIEDMTQAELVQLRYNYVMSVTKNAQGDFERTSSGAANQMRIFTESVKELGATFGENLLPVITPMIKNLNEMIKAFGQMDVEQQQMIIKTLGIVAVVGPAILTFGKFTSAIGSIASFMGMFRAASVVATAATVGTEVAAAGAATSIGTFGGAVGLATAGIAPFVLGAAAVAGAGYLIYKTLTTETTPAINLFADGVDKSKDKINLSYKEMLTGVEGANIKISESTKKAVQAYLDLDKDAEKSLNHLYVNGTKITSDTAKNLVDKYNEMGKAIKTGMDKSTQAEYDTLKSFFDKSSTLTEKEEKDALDSLKKNNEDKKKSINDYVKQISDIYNKAAKDNREINKEEAQQIEDIRKKMQEQAVKALSDTELESKVILERLKSYGTRITAEQASEEIKNAEAAKQGTIKAANEQYDETVKAIIKARDETHTITADQADKLIADAQRQKEETIKKADEQKTEVVNKIKSMNSDIEKSVDTSSGKILTIWDGLAKWWANWSPGIKTFIAQVQQTGNNAGTQRWTGDSNFQGGFTTLHEKGYELYDLPSGTRIFNHEASADLVRQTATEVAKSVVSKNENKSNSENNNNSMKIIIPVNFDGKTVATVTYPYSDKMQGKNIKLTGRNLGI